MRTVAPLTCDQAARVASVSGSEWLTPSKTLMQAPEGRGIRRDSAASPTPLPLPPLPLLSFGVLTRSANPGGGFGEMSVDFRSALRGGGGWRLPLPRPLPPRPRALPRAAAGFTVFVDLPMQQ